MRGEPGVPVYLRTPSRGLISLAFIAFGCLMVYLGAVQGWTLVLVTCFAVAMTILALVRTEYAILGLVIMSNFDGFLKPLFDSRFSLLFKDYFVLLALVRWGWGLFSGEDRPSFRTVVAVPALLFAGYVLAEVANPNARSILQSVAGVRAWLIWIPVFFIAYDYLTTREAIERLWIVATVCSLIVAAYGIVQYFIGFEHLYRLSPSFEYYSKMGYFLEGGSRVNRVFGTMVSPGVFGTAMGFMALVACGLVLSAKSRVHRTIAAVAVPVVVIGLFFSGSRSAVIGAALGLVVLFALCRRPVVLMIGLVLLAGGIWQSMRLSDGAVGERMATATWEYSSNRAFGPLVSGYNIALRHPFGLGVASGTGVARVMRDGGLKDSSTPFLENDLGRAFGELGVPGALLYLGLVFCAFYGAGSAWLRIRAPAMAALSAGVIGAAILVAAGLATGAALYLAPGAPYFWLAIATAMRLPDVMRARVASDGAAPAGPEAVSTTP